MWMSDVLKNTAGYKLSCVCFMPEDFPFEIHKSAQEKNAASENDGCEFGEGYFPNTVIRSERTNEDDE